MIKKIFISISLIITALTCWIGYRAIASKPQYHGEMKASVKELVKVHFDELGVPHIHATNELDAYYALGSIMASERLFQMDVYRRLSQGKLSEVFGAKTIKTDKLFRSLRLGQTIAQNLKTTPIDEFADNLMDSFLKGVNDYISNATLPLEFLILNYQPHPFSKEDIYSFIGYMGYSFGIAFKVDLLYSDLKNKLPYKVWNDLRYRPDDISSPKTVYNSALQNKLSILQSNLDDVFKIIDEQLGTFEGSNAWAIGKSKSKSGYPILASDPHISFTNPGIWYEAHLKTPGREIYGHFLPLVPFAVLGHDQHKGWGITISYFDDMDFFKFKVDGNLYQFGNEKRELKTFNEIIKVKGQEDINYQVNYTHLGPMLGDYLGREGNIGLAWTYYLKRNRPLHGLFHMGRAKNKEEFKKAVSYATSPGLNMIYADDKGNIARYIHGTIPKRKKGVIGDIILDASDPYFIYDQYYSFSELPHLENPKEDVIVSANFQPEDSDVFGYWQPNDRYETIHHSLKVNEKWDIKDLQMVQTANVNVFNIALRTIFSKNLRDKNYYFQLSDTQKILLTMMETWNGEYAIDSLGASVFHVFANQVIRAMMDELNDEDFERYCRLAISWRNLKKFVYQPNHEIWDIKGTGDTEDRNDVLVVAMKKTQEYLESRGGSPSIAWGKIHPIIFEHPLGKAPLIGGFFNGGPYEAPGAYNQINNMRNVGCQNGFLTKAGPSTRRLIDFADTTMSYGILPFGNSGHILSPFYGDQVKAFLEGKYRVQKMGPSKGKSLNFIPRK
ncbi:MAG: penicillin acylase family protein [Oligoflexia bacterium]|nr:penicillin acylase family protein [Oligoflexia bacterium]